MFNSLESCSQFPIGRCGTGAQCYLGILHEAYCRSQFFNRKLINRDGGRSHTFCTHLFSPKGLVTEEWHNCCWALSSQIRQVAVDKQQKQRIWNEHTRQSEWTEAFKWKCNHRSFKTSSSSPCAAMMDLQYIKKHCYLEANFVSKTGCQNHTNGISHSCQTKSKFFKKEEG